MADAVRAYNWAVTPLGPIESWSETLLCSVNSMLSSRFPTVIFWGAEMIQFYNNAYLPLMAEKHPGALGQAASECWKEAWHITGPQFEAVFQRGEAIFKEDVLVPVMRQGQLRDVYWTYSYSPIAEPTGETGGILVVCHDVTKIIVAGRERDALAERLQQVFDTTTDAIFSLDRDWRFTFLNRKARELLAPSGDVLGTVVWNSFPDAVYEGSPYQEHYHHAMAEKQASEFEAFYPEPLNLWFHVEARPAEAGIIVFFRDITQQKKDQKAFRQKQAETERQRAELEAVYNTAPIGLALFDPTDFRYLRMNTRQAEIMGLPVEKVIGTRVTDLAPIPGLQELFEKVAAGEPVRNHLLEGELATEPGEHRYWTVNYYPVHNEHGEVEAISAASLEITQQKRAEAALVRSDKLAAVGRLAASIAHEINNPLESVTNLLYLARSSTDAAEIQRYLDVAERELKRIAAISNQTLRFYRQSTNPREVTAEDLFESVLSIYQGRIVNSRVKVEQDKISSSPVLCFDGEIRQVLGNLVGNAVDSMSAEGGRLVLRSRTATNWNTGEQGLRLTVADTGYGISPDVMQKMFDAFFTTKGLGGTGLGLWVSQEIVQRHRGTLRVRSSQREDMKGTVFSLFLPFKAAIRRDV